MMLEGGMGCGPLVLVELHLSGFASIFVTEKYKCKVTWSMYKFRSSETDAHHPIRCCLQIGVTTGPLSYLILEQVCKGAWTLCQHLLSGCTVVRICVVSAHSATKYSLWNWCCVMSDFSVRADTFAVCIVFTISL